MFGSNSLAYQGTHYGDGAEDFTGQREPLLTYFVMLNGVSSSFRQER